MNPKRLSIKKETVQSVKTDLNPVENPGKSRNRVIRRYERSGMPLSHDRAKDLYVRYNEEIKSDLENSRNERLPNAAGFQGTEYVWISRKRLKLYLRFLKELEALNPDQPEITGVSLYFGRIGYEDDNVYEGSGEPEEVGDEPPKVGDYRGRHTLFMAPTIRKEEIEGPEMLKHKAFYVDSEFTEGFERYIGNFEVLPFLEEVPFAGGGTEGGDPGDDDGTSLLSNDLNNMPPMSS
ncbi:hypothetical protein POV27_12650 [Aureisphaera galaxeae]|uniref:hypothetical protein n=1 Tax=Aureisphaera galaxeae TaxID=1538023 RepID=UPI0023507991|nr:hypothetical protein [Aureisphaera galaxeae]MDC8004904.1 hypothetical protein [Aureisphaera galaxeae]